MNAVQMKRLLTVSIIMAVITGCGGSIGGGGGGSNHSPLGVDDAYTVTKNAAVTSLDVLANDTDEDNDTLAIKVGSVTAPNHNGTAVITNGKIDYRPAAGYSGTETFQYIVTDGTHDSNATTVTVTIGNQIPVATDDTLSIARAGAAVAINVLANDTDADGDTLQIKAGSVTSPNHGGTAVIAGGKITYTPPVFYSGVETFQYTVNDGTDDGNAATVTVTVNKVWDTAAHIESNAGDVNSVWVAMDANGNAAAVWDQAADIRSNRFDGSNWGADQSLKSGLASPTSFPHLALNSSGIASAVWMQTGVGGVNDIVSNLYDGGWGNAKVIETDVNDTRDPKVGIDSTGNAYAAWIHNDGNDTIRAGKYSTATGNWLENPTPVGAEKPGLEFPQIAVSGHGDAIVVWGVAYNTTYEVWMNYYDVDTAGWIGERKLSTTPAGMPYAAINNDGDAVVVWQGTHPGGKDGIHASQYTASSNTWSVPEFIETNGGASAQKPKVAMDSSGNAIAVWEQNTSSPGDIFANRYIPGTGWGTAVLLETDDTTEAHRPSIAMNNNGDAIVAWEQYDADAAIMVNRYTAATDTWEGPTAVKAPSSDHAVSAKASINGDGKATVVWIQLENGSWHVWANTYR